MTDSIIQDTRYLSGRVYYNKKYTRNLGYQLLEKQENTRNGFFAEAYYKNGNLLTAREENYPVTQSSSIKNKQ